MNEPGWDQINHHVDDDAIPEEVPEPLPCLECEDPTTERKDGKPCHHDCDLPHDCSDDPCDRHNPYSGTRPW